MDAGRDNGPNDDQKRSKDSKNAWSYLNIGLQYAVTVGASAWVGNWIDLRYKCEPWGVLCCTLFGIAAATYLLLKEVS